MTSVADPTRLRGALDTPWSSLPKDRGLWAMLAVSLAVHLLISFGPTLLTLWGLWQPLEAPAEEVPLDAIPVDLLGEEAVTEPPPAPVALPPEPVTVKDPEAPAVAKAPPPSKPKPPSEAPASEPSPKTGTLGDPVSKAGLAGKAVDSNANVRLLLHMGPVREHPVGRRIGGLLERTPQWNDFFGTAGVDPVEDVDHVLVAGPQLRNSSNVAAVVQHHLTPAEVTAAFERMVARGGEWVERKPPIVRAKADRAERFFAAPNARIVAVVPLSAEKSVRKLSSKLGFPAAGAAALEAYVITPWRVARGTPLKVPESILWARFEVRAEAEGGALVLVEAEDESPESAEEHAAALQKQLRSLVNQPFVGVLVRHIEFEAKEKQIHGTIRFTKNELLNLLDLADFILPPLPPRQSFEKLDPPSSPEPAGKAPLTPPTPVPGSTDPPATPEPAPSAAPQSKDAEPPPDSPPAEPSPTPAAP